MCKELYIVHAVAISCSLLAPAMAPLPASAASKKIVSTRCDQIRDDVKAVDCEAREYVRRSAQRIAANNARKACADFLIAGINKGQWTKEAVLAQARGKITDDNVCQVARSKGYKGRKP